MWMKNSSDKNNNKWIIGDSLKNSKKKIIKKKNNEEKEEEKEQLKEYILILQNFQSRNKTIQVEFKLATIINKKTNKNDLNVIIKIKLIVEINSK